jgi:hypothetical protein
MGLFKTFITVNYLLMRVGEGGVDRELHSLLVKNESIEIHCTAGKILITILKNPDIEILKKIIQCLVEIDPTIHHEIEVLCSYEDVEAIAGKGYKLISYARKGDKYKALFLAPFSERLVIDEFLKCIIRDFNETNIVAREFYWNSDEMTILKFKEKLLELGEWEVQMEYR